LHRGARSRGYKRCEGARAGEREKERDRPRGELSQSASTASLLLCLPQLACLRLFVRRTFVRSVFIRFFPFSFFPRKAMDIPFYRYKEMPNCTMGV
jgi:hypothetical protein